MNVDQLQEVGCIEEARYVSFNRSLTGITKDKLYEVMLGRPIGIDAYANMPGTNELYSDEYYIVNDHGKKQHGIWGFYKHKCYK